MGPGGTALGVNAGNRPCLHALIWDYKVTSSPSLTRSLPRPSWKYLLYKTISAALQRRSSSRHGQRGRIPTGGGCSEAGRREGASSRSGTLLFTLPVTEPWKPERPLLLLLKERLGRSDGQELFHSSSRLLWADGAISALHPDSSLLFF